MPKITKILHLENKDTYAVVYVQLNDGEEAEVYVGGNCQVYYHHNKIKAFVMKGKVNDTNIKQKKGENPYRQCRECNKFWARAKRNRDLK